MQLKKVSAHVCKNCGEAYYTPEVSRKIDVVMKRFHESKLLLHPVGNPFTPSGLGFYLEDLFGVPVDVVSERALHPMMRDDVLMELVPV